MAAKDLYHEAVVKALTDEDWKITHDPLTLEVGDVDFEIDLGAEKLIAAEKESRKIAVEVKSFLGSSPIYEFHGVLGQFLNYRDALAEKEPERTLYVAVPIDAYEELFLRQFIQQVVRRYQLKLIVYSPLRKVIVEWLE
ncbi:MAG: fatty-acid oxidation protein subunit alpha [Caldilinea sp. CFX5]|nr:fatty-acid oxidation protein subunit alpha [Caldilinea sp. CFX5]